MALNVIAVEVIEETAKPANHDFMIVPSLDELTKEMLAMMGAEGGED